MGKTIFVLFLVFAVALVGTAPSVSLAEDPSNYVVLKGGLYSHSNDFDLQGQHFNHDDGFVAVSRDEVGRVRKTLANQKTAR